MKKLNNKGFAISTMLYGLLILIVLIIAMILSTMAFNRKNSREFSEKIVDDLESKERYFYTNQNIVIAYTYDENNCVTGDEDTCQQISLTTSNTDIPTGTIIKYKVNDTDIVTFHVMYDNGSTLTMQSQKNIGNNTIWISEEDYKKTGDNSCNSTSGVCNNQGPVTVLTALEKETSNWTNVNSQNYQMGDTKWPYFFQSNSSTGCSKYNDCSTNTYKFASSRTAKARMITVQEAAQIKIGCRNSNVKCPIWMYNYLYNSTDNGGTANDTTVDSETGKYKTGYWMMNANSLNNAAWYIYYDGFINSSNINNEHVGARAVVVINK